LHGTLGIFCAIHGCFSFLCEKFQKERSVGGERQPGLKHGLSKIGANKKPCEIKKQLTWTKKTLLENNAIIVCE